jgi:biotin carboxyl carrier protein
VPSGGTPPRAAGGERAWRAAPYPAAASYEPAGQGQVLAPIPGVIDSIAVQPGDGVVRGQELLVLEAMKMKNVIRATRAGTVAAVHVTARQHVKHGDPLVELQD